MECARIVAFMSMVALELCAGRHAFAADDAAPGPLPENHGRVNTELYLGEGGNQPLIVAFGGSEGGNAWANIRWKPQRDRLLARGYAFLALAYFGEKGHPIPKQLDRISLDAVHDAILAAASNPRINARCIALIGVSRGAELALVLASHFPTSRPLRQ